MKKNKMQIRKICVMAFASTVISNKRAMLRSLGGVQILKKKTHKNKGGKSQSFKKNNNNNKIIIINEKGVI